MFDKAKQDDTILELKIFRRPLRSTRSVGWPSQPKQKIFEALEQEKIKAFSEVEKYLVETNAN